MPVLPASLHGVTVICVNQLSHGHFSVITPQWYTCILRIPLTWAPVLLQRQQSHTMRQPSRRMTEAQVSFTSLLSHTQWLQHADCITYPGSLSVSQLVSCPGIVAPIKGDGLAHFKAFQLEDRRWTDACLVLAIVQGASLSVAAMALQCCKCMDYATDINKQAICSIVPELCLLLPYP